jgi:hypothetical protein
VSSPYTDELELVPVPMFQEKIRYDRVAKDMTRVEIDEVLGLITHPVGESRVLRQCAFIDWMQRAMDGDTKRKYFSDLSIDWIAEILVMQRCLQQLECYFPCFKVFQIKAKNQR